MSEDFVNQLTLNFLVNKQHLYKINKKKLSSKEIQKYANRIKILFNDLLVSKPPDDLLNEVNMSFETFIEKSIYYFKHKSLHQ